MTKIKDGEIVDYVKDIHIADPLLASPATPKEAPVAPTLSNAPSMTPVFTTTVAKATIEDTTNNPNNRVVAEPESYLLGTPILTDEPLPEEAVTTSDFEKVVLDDASRTVQNFMMDASLTPEAKALIEKNKRAIEIQTAIQLSISAELKKQSNGMKIHVQNRINILKEACELEVSIPMNSQIKALEWVLTMIDRVSP